MSLFFISIWAIKLTDPCVIHRLVTEDGGLDAFTWPDYDFMSNNAVPKAPPTSTERNNALIADLRRIPSVQDVEIVTPSEAEVSASLTDSMWRKFFADEDEADAGIKTMVNKDALDEGDAFVPSNEAPEDRNAVTALGTPDAGLLYLVHDFASYPDWDFKPHYDALARDPYVANIGIGRFRAYSKYRYFFPSPSTNVRAIATNYRDDLRMKASLLFLIIVRAIRLSDSCFVYRRSAAKSRMTSTLGRCTADIPARTPWGAWWRCRTRSLTNQRRTNSVGGEFLLMCSRMGNLNDVVFCVLKGR